MPTFNQLVAQGRKRLVVVDPYGKAHNPTRLVKGIKAKDLHALLSDLDLSTLPDANAVQVKMQFREVSRNQKTVAPDPQAQPVSQAKSRITGSGEIAFPKLCLRSPRFAALFLG